jgi:hypothetical protein
MNFGRQGDGEHGALAAEVRRLGGGGVRKLPVLVTIDHAPGASYAELRARFGRMDMDLVGDYLPKQVSDLLQAEGTVELGTTLESGNKLGEPWVTLRLRDVTLMPPKDYSAAFKFPKLTVTASYRPSPTDLLTIKEVTGVYKSGAVMTGRGWVQGVTGPNPLASFALRSPGGDVQTVFDFLPDQRMEKAMPWLRQRIKDARYADLELRYQGHPKDMPFCGDHCGLVLSAAVPQGQVKFADELPALTDVSGSFVVNGDDLVVATGPGKMGEQRSAGVTVRITRLFTPGPTHVVVSTTMAGPPGPLLKGLGAWLDKPLPQAEGGRQVTAVNVDLPVIRHHDPKFEDALLGVVSRVQDADFRGLPLLPEQAVRVRDAHMRIEKGRLSVSASAVVEGQALNLEASDELNSFGDHLRLGLDGMVPAAELVQRLGAAATVSAAGPVRARVSAVPAGNGWTFSAALDGAGAQVAVPAAAWRKAAGDPLQATLAGTVVSASAGWNIDLPKLDVNGKDVRVLGSIVWNAGRPESDVVRLNPLRLGRSDVTVTAGAGKAVVRGRMLDLTGIDLFGKGESGIRNLDLDVRVDRLMTREATLSPLVAGLTARNGRWNLRTLQAKVDGNPVNVASTMLADKRERMSVNVADLGKLLRALGLYQDLRGGRLSGDITYDAPGVGGGVLEMKKFEVANPPVLVRLLGMLSLQQLLAGGDSTLFDSAEIPLRLDGAEVHLDNVTLDGPSMGIRLNGTYNRDSHELNIDGQLAPALPFNRLVGKIPLLGTLLTGSQEGVVVADFKLKGNADSPDISVRPLSVLTPGLLKDLWHGLTGGGAKAPPKPNVIDGRSKTK